MKRELGLGDNIAEEFTQSQADVFGDGKQGRKIKRCRDQNENVKYIAVEEIEE